MKKTNLLLFVACAAFSLQVHATDKIRLILDWFVNPNHAQIIVAKEKGMFEKHDLEVEIIEPSDPAVPPKLVAAGKADLAVSYQPFLYLNIADGLPISRVGTLIASPLNTLIVRADSGIEKIADLKGRKIGYSVPGMDETMLGPILESDGLTLNDVELVNVNWLLTQSLISGQVDAVLGGMRNFELTEIAQKGVPGHAFYLEEHGIPAYDELILVANNQDRDTPKFARFNAALEEATLYILNHPEDAWNAYTRYKKDLDDPLNRAAWQDTLPRFSLTPGALDVARYQRYGEFLQSIGLIDAVPPLHNYAIEP